MPFVHLTTGSLLTHSRNIHSAKKRHSMVAACLREALSTLRLKGKEWAILRHWLQKEKRLAVSGGKGTEGTGAGYREHMCHLLACDLQPAPTCYTPNC